MFIDNVSTMLERTCPVCNSFGTLTAASRDQYPVFIGKRIKIDTKLTLEFQCKHCRNRWEVARKVYVDSEQSYSSHKHCGKKICNVTRIVDKFYQVYVDEFPIYDVIIVKINPDGSKTNIQAFAVSDSKITFYDPKISVSDTVRISYSYTMKHSESVGDQIENFT